MRTRSACVLLAWGILLLLMAAGSSGSPRPAQANNRTATSTTSTTSFQTTTVIQATLASTLTSPLASSPASRPDAATALTAPHQETRADAGASKDTGDSTAIGTATDGGAPTAAGKLTDTEKLTDTGTPTDTGTDGGRPGDTAYAARPGAAYVVQPGDTLSAIAAALGIRGGWPALYAANRRLIGPDPDVIRAGTVLALPGLAAPARYTVAAGDTLTGIAAALRTRGGWPALYAANRRDIGPDPDLIRAGAVLMIPRPGPGSRPPRPARRPSPPPATAPAPTRTKATAPSPPRLTAPALASGKATARATASPSAKAPAAGGLPRWLQIVLLAAGILIGAAFLAEPALAITRRRRNDRQNTRPAAGPAARPTADRRIVLADYDRLVVTSSSPDGTVFVLRPPGADPEVILLAARLVLSQDRYEELAGHLGVTAPRGE